VAKVEADYSEDISRIQDENNGRGGPKPKQEEQKFKIIKNNRLIMAEPDDD